MTIQKQPLLLLISKIVVPFSTSYQYSKTTFVTVNQSPNIGCLADCTIQKQPLLLLIPRF